MDEKLKTEIFNALQYEIQEQSKEIDKNSKIKIESIFLVKNSTNNYIYQIEVEKRVDYLLADQTISVNNKGKIINATVISSKDYSLIIATSKKINVSNHLSISFDPTIILKSLNKYLETALFSKKVQKLFDFKAGCNVKDKPFKQASEIPQEFNKSQNQAIINSLNNSIHFIWGPPGTGKTKTLGQIVARLLKAKKSCLLLSLSNAAVDQLMKSVLEQTRGKESDEITRVGFPSESSLEIYTPKNKYLRNNPNIKRKLEELNDYRNQLDKEISYLRTQSLNKKNTEEIDNKISKTLQKIDAKKDEINIIEQKVSESTKEIVSENLCIVTTLATFVLKQEINTLDFDAVIIDEISMVPMLFILAASKLGLEYLILAGDPNQLPPIYLSEENLVKKWFGRNIFDYLKINSPGNHSDVSFLDEQYRMQNVISQLVSSLSYENKLICKTKDNIQGEVICVNLENIIRKNLYLSSFYNLNEKSYFFPLSILIIKAIINSNPFFRNNNILLLSPFRSQEKLLNKLCNDLNDEFPDKNKTIYSSSTIHKSQGHENEVIIVDFTIFDPQTEQHFFKEADTAKKLINVALSRAKSKLFVLTNMRMIEIMGRKFDSFYTNLAENLKQNIMIDAEELIKKELKSSKNWLEIVENLNIEVENVIYSATNLDSNDYLKKITDFFKKVNFTNTPLLIHRSNHKFLSHKGIVLKEKDEKYPPIGIFGPNVAINLGNIWFNIKLPKTSKNLVNFFSDSNNNSQDFKVESLICPKCRNGNLELSKNEGYLLMKCSKCNFSKWPNLSDASLIININHIICPNCHVSLVGKKSFKEAGKIFFSCPNYPKCTYSENMYKYALSGR